MTAVIALFAQGASADDGSRDLCLAAAHRVTVFLETEAKGTRHEAQIQKAYDEKGGRGAVVTALAKTFNDDACAMLIAAPDSTVRALAIAALPELSE